VYKIVIANFKQTSNNNNNNNKMKKTLLILTLIPTICFGQWNQKGNDIDGVQANERSGSAIGINASGEIVIVGARNNSTNGTASGQARVFEWSGTSWTQKGSLINGDIGGDNLGKSVAINDSGNIIALGAPAFLSSPITAGYAKVFQWNGSDWSQLGSTFNGTTSDDSYGTSISLNASGSIVAIAAEANPGSSYIRVFEWNGSVWNQLGTDIMGTSTPQDGFGRTIQLNASGTVLVVGATNFDGSDNMNGLLRVYEWNGTSWVQKGSDLIGDAELDNFGAGVTVNDDGTIIAAGARATLNASKGYLKIFEWNGTDWIQKGNTIWGNDADFFGDENDLNSAGDIIIAGTVLGEYAKILKFDGINWLELDSIPGEAPADQFGSAVCINYSGSTVSIGAFGNDAGGNQSGHVRVFENSTILSVEYMNEFNELKFYPNPTYNFIQITSGSDVFSYSITTFDGKEIRSNRQFQGKEFSIDFSELSVGIYFLTLQTKDKIISTKIIKN